MNPSVTFETSPPPPREWVTAKVIQSNHARRFIRRLDSLGFEYKVVIENRHLRILVREQSLEEVLEWFDDLASPVKPQSKQDVVDTRMALSVLIAIPLGMLVGSVFAYVAGIPSPLSQTVSGFCGFVAAIFAIIYSCREK